MLNNNNNNKTNTPTLIQLTEGEAITPTGEPLLKLKCAAMRYTLQLIPETSKKDDGEYQLAPRIIYITAVSSQEVTYQLLSPENIKLEGTISLEKLYVNLSSNEVSLNEELIKKLTPSLGLFFRNLTEKHKELKGMLPNIGRLHQKSDNLWYFTNEHNIEGLADGPYAYVKLPGESSHRAHQITNVKIVDGEKSSLTEHIKIASVSPVAVHAGEVTFSQGQHLFSINRSGGYISNTELLHQSGFPDTVAFKCQTKKKIIPKIDDTSTPPANTSYSHSNTSDTMKIKQANEVSAEIPGETREALHKQETSSWLDCINCFFPFNRAAEIKPNETETVTATVSEKYAIN